MLENIKNIEQENSYNVKSDVQHNVVRKKLSKLGRILEMQNISQTDFIKRLEKLDCKMEKSAISLHVNGKRKFMTTATAKIFARALGVSMEDIC